MQPTEHLSGMESRLDAYRRVLPTGDAYLLDPDLGEVLDPRRPYHMLATDARLRSGYQYLQARGPATQLTIFYSEHTEAADLGADSQFENLVANTDIYALELYGWTEGHLAQLGRLATKYGSFMTRQMAAIQRANKPYLSPDVEIVPAPKPAPERSIAGLIRDQDALEKLIRGLNPDNKSAEAAAQVSRILTVQTDLDCVSKAFREWYMVGRMGYELQRRVPSVHGPLKVLLSVGVGHADLTRKFRVLGVDVTPAGFSMAEVMQTRQQEQSEIDYRVDLVTAIATSLIPQRLREVLVVAEES